MKCSKTSNMPSHDYYSSWSLWLSSYSCLRRNQQIKLSSLQWASLSKCNRTLNVEILLEFIQNTRNLNPKTQLNIHGAFLFIQTYPWKTQFWNDNHNILGSKIILYINVCCCHSCCCVICTHKYTREYAYMRLKTHLEL